MDHLLLETDDITPLLEVMEAHLKSRTFLVGRGLFGMYESMAMQLFRLRKSSPVSDLQKRLKDVYGAWRVDARPKSSVAAQLRIYRIIPPKPEIVRRPPMHKSKHSPMKPPTCTTFGPLGKTCPKPANVAGDWEDNMVPQQQHATLGKPRGDYAEHPAEYLKKAKNGGKVLTLAQLKREHPEALKGSLRFIARLPGIGS